MIVEWFEVESVAGVEAILACYGGDRRRLTDPELDEQIRWFADDAHNTSVEDKLRAERAWRDQLDGGAR